MTPEISMLDLVLIAAGFAGFAVAIACKPATPAPRTSTCAAAMVPAAVIIMGNSLGSASAARRTAS